MIAKLRERMMSKRFLLAVAVLVLTSTLLTHRILGRESTITFPETGHTISGPFQEYWEKNGGLSVFGFPITPVLWEDGREVQYFERNRFELHPENAPPYNVLLGRLGEERLRAVGRDWYSQRQGREQEGCLFFPETKRSLCGELRAFWEQHGGLAVFGYPITEPAQELSETDGKIYTVQYFERNRFELHPENAPPYNVQLGLLGSWRVKWLLGQNRQPHPTLRATISGPAEAVRPLSNVTLAVAAQGYSGPSELIIFDAAGRTITRQQLQITNGTAHTSILAQGALGPQAAVLLIEGRIAGLATAALTLDAETSISTGHALYDSLYPRVREMMGHDTSEYEIDGYRVYGYRSPDSFLLWMRDHVYQALGYRYFERDMTSLLDHFRRYQRADGSFDDYIAKPHWGLIKGRMDVEADLEFLFIQGVYQAWQATGDDSWVLENMDAMRRGLHYITSDPLRWEPTYQLVKRPFTIDMWDFEYGGKMLSPDGQLAARHWIDENTKWSIMHGDNTGLAYAMNLLGEMEAHFGNYDAAAALFQRSKDLMAALNALSWNGTFYKHQHHITPVEVKGVDESKQLSLSNSHVLNRGVLNYDQAFSILQEYYRRYLERGQTFAEWHSIDPPFPANSFGTENGWGKNPGEYVNGGIMPLVGGELSRGAFQWGQELYGFDILRRYINLVRIQKGSYLWYYPAGNPGRSGDDSLSTDGWGSSSMLAALIEGAAGVEDSSVLYRTVEISPRWTADPDVRSAQVVTRYGASYGYVAYHWTRHEQALQLQLTGTLDSGVVRLLLPEDAPEELEAQVNGRAATVRFETFGKSRYAIVDVQGPLADVRLSW